MSKSTAIESLVSNVDFFFLFFTFSVTHIFYFAFIRSIVNLSVYFF